MPGQCRRKKAFFPPGFKFMDVGRTVLCLQTEQFKLIIINIIIVIIIII